jgi:hypothetical protein
LIRRWTILTFCLLVLVPVTTTSATAQGALPGDQLLYLHEDSGGSDPQQALFNFWKLDFSAPEQAAPVARLDLRGAQFGGLVLSRDRTRFAFTSSANLTQSLEAVSAFVMNVDGTGLRQVSGFGTIGLLDGPTGTVTGRVVLEPLAGAGTGTLTTCLVTAPGTTSTASCDADGRFTLSNVPVKAGWVKVQAAVSYPAVFGTPGLAYGFTQVQVRAGDVTDAGTIGISPQHSRSLEPSWSRDGTRLLVTFETTGSYVQGNRDTGAPEMKTASTQKLGIWRLDGQPEQVISIREAPTVNLSGADWSPVDDTIACAGFGSSSAIILINPDGTDAQGIWQPPADLQVIRSVEQCRWSPDGRQIAFTLRSLTTDASAAWSELYTIGRDGRGLQQVVSGSPGRFVRSPTWSQDGRAIAFSYQVHSRDYQQVESEDLYAKVLGQSGFVQLTNDGRSLSPAW